MPKVTNTRKQRAAELWERIKRGPHHSVIGMDKFTVPEAEATYRRWSESWILAEVADLIPELRGKLDSLGNIKHDD